LAADVATDYRKSMDRFALHEGAAAAYRLVDAANEFHHRHRAVALAREASQADRLNQVLYEVSEAVRIAGLLLLPIMPRSAGEILRRMGETQPAASLRLDRDAVWRTGGARPSSRPSRCGRASRKGRRRRRVHAGEHDR